MTPLTYLIQVTCCLALMYAFFLLALQKETTFQSNRFYLISSLLISSLLPFVKIYIDEQLARTVVTAPAVFVGHYMDSFERAITVTATEDRLNWSEIFLRIYVAGIVVFSFRFLNEILKIGGIKSSGTKIVLHNHLCILSYKVKSPFSFFNTIFLPHDHGFNADEFEEVISHEHGHIKGRHTWDVLFVEVIIIGLWLSPLVYLYRRKLREIHEYLADAAVIKNTNWEKYAEFLLAQKSSGLQNQLSNQLMYSQLKNRIVMMSKKPSSRMGRIKYLGFIPLLLIAFVIFSFREKLSNRESVNTGPREFSETGKYNIYTDGLKVYAMLDSPWVFRQEDTLPNIHINAVRLPNNESKGEVLNDPTNRSEAFTYVEKMPRFVSCDHLPESEWMKCSTEALYAFLSSNIKYPDIARKNAIEGKVIVQFIVEANGELSNIRVIKGVSPELDDEALRVMNKMQPWVPGKHNGRNVAVIFTLPIKFVLEDTKHETDQTITTVADEMPRFPGCESLPERDRIGCANEAMYKFISETIKYPNDDRQKENEGTVIARFIIDEGGTMIDPKIVRGVSPGLDEEVMRVISKMKELPQKWIPGRQKGNPVAVMLTVPFKFALESEKRQPLKTGDRLHDLWGEIEVKDAENPMENSWIQIRPNPASENIELEILENVESIRIAGISKVIMWQKENVARQSKFSIDVSNWSSGKYIIYLYKGGVSKNAGFIVQH